MRIPITRYGAREVITGSAACLALTAAAVLLFWPAAPLIGLLWLWLLAFFRDPDRTVPEAPKALLSPADGTVWDVERVEPPGEFLEGPCVRIGIFMSIFDVHVNRSPASATVSYRRRVPGRHLDARKAAAPIENERNLLGISTADGRQLLLQQIAGAVARRIVCEAEPGIELAAGQRFGMVKFGSRVELFVPEADQFHVSVRPGDRVKAGKDILGTYPS
ncbi:MAG: phosphatidylserine decarboxylase [Candidatus Brocadiaceae bacterium]